jgi:hypothetical protein
MAGSITKNQLIRFIYSESNERESLRIQEALNVDDYLSETYEELKKAIQRLPRIRKNPTQKTVQSILSYSRKEKFKESFH